MFQKYREAGLESVPDIVDYYSAELEQALEEARLKGSIARQSSELPGTIAYRFSQLQDIESIIAHIELEVKRLKGEKLKNLLERHNRSLSIREAEKLVEFDEEILTYLEIKNELENLRNKYLGIIKALESKNFQLNNLTKLKCAGFEDFAV